MKVNKVSKNSSEFPCKLRDIPNPPKQLFYIGKPPATWDALPKVAVVGSRRPTAYGRAVTIQFARALAEQGICIISGLALGTDALAHSAALEVGGGHVAILPAGLKEIYPATNRQLAEKLLENGGCLISEYEYAMPSLKQNYIARNRLVSGMADALLIIEAAEKSGTLHTARFALEQGRDVLVIPGNINSPNSVGTNNLIKSGAIPVTNIDDILTALNITRHTKNSVKHHSSNPNEQKLIELLYSGITEANELQIVSQLGSVDFSTALTMLEINGTIRPLGNNHWSLN